jgi:hypothetical protein
MPNEAARAVEPWSPTVAVTVVAPGNVGVWFAVFVSGSAIVLAAAATVFGKRKRSTGLLGNPKHASSRSARRSEANPKHASFRAC